MNASTTTTELPTVGYYADRFNAQQKQLLERIVTGYTKPYGDKKRIDWALAFIEHPEFITQLGFSPAPGTLNKLAETDRTVVSTYVQYHINKTHYALGLTRLEKKRAYNAKYNAARRANRNEVANMHPVPAPTQQPSKAVYCVCPKCGHDLRALIIALGIQIA